MGGAGGRRLVRDGFRRLPEAEQRPALWHRILRPRGRSRTSPRSRAVGRFRETGCRERGGGGDHGGCASGQQSPDIHVELSPLPQPVWPHAPATAQIPTCLTSLPHSCFYRYFLLPNGPVVAVTAFAGGDFAGGASALGSCPGAYSSTAPTIHG